MSTKPPSGRGRGAGGRGGRGTQRGRAGASASGAAGAAAATPPAAAPPPRRAPASPARRAARPGRARALIGAAIAAAAAAAIAIVAARGGRPDAAPPRAAAPAKPAPPALAPAAPLPARPARPANAFVGSARCRDCHEAEHARWQASWHARALAPGKRPFVLGDFNDAHFSGTSSEAWMKRAGDRYVMRARDAAGTLADFPVDWVIGGKRMQDNVTVFPDGRWQILPVYYHVTGRAWVDYTETKQGPLTPEHPFYWTNVRRMANHECLDCHTTGLRVSYAEQAGRWETSFIDGSVACESCHGAGGRHAETTEPADVVHPVGGGATALAACARCHGPRRPLFPMLDPDHQFALGDSYDELYDPIVVVHGAGMSGDYFVDGRPKTSSFEYQAMLQAECFRKGGATCVTCHTAPHDPKQGHAELRGRDPDASCKGCHPAIAAAPAAHTRHRAVAAQRCIACHMPPVVSGVLDHFADHAIDVPAPQNTARHGVPSACGVCHADRTPAQLTASLAAWWPQASARQARRLRLADAFDPKTPAKASALALLGVIADHAEAPTLRGAAAIVLARRGGPQVARALLPLLASPDLVLRAKGAEALGVARAAGAADALVARLSDPSLRVRYAAALALQDVGDPRAEAALRQLADAPASAHLMVPHFELGRALAGRGELAAARAELTWVARLTPYFTDGLVELAAVAAAQGDRVEAQARLAQALALEPHHARGRALAARLAGAAAPAAPPTTPAPLAEPGHR